MVYGSLLAAIVTSGTGGTSVAPISKASPSIFQLSLMIRRYTSRELP
jgi:hypothetical protein